MEAGDHPTEPCESTGPVDGRIEPKAPKVAAKVSWWHLHRRLYDWVLHWADTPYGGPALFIMSFAESSFFPVPPDVLLAPLVLGNRKKWLGYALSCSVASILGGMLGYFIGSTAWGVVGDFVQSHVPGLGRDQVVFADGREQEGAFSVDSVEVALPLMHAEVQWPAKWTGLRGAEMTLAESDVSGHQVNAFTKAGGLYSTYDFWIVFIAGFSPLPYKVITITAGVFKINFAIFMMASAVSRSARFFLVAGLMGICGPWMKPVIDRYFDLLCIAFVILLLGGFAFIKYL